MTDQRALFWDFDGVILDSMPIRDEGFAQVLKPWKPREIEAFLDYHRQNGGLSRYHKFRYFFTEILKVPVSEEAVKSLSAEFSEIMRRLLVNRNLLIQDSIAFIERYHTEIPMFIVSGSDGNELRFLCQELAINSFFKQIEGSPTPKIKLVADLLETYGFEKGNVLLIGDSGNDFDAARENGIRFSGYNNPDLEQMPGYIRRLSVLTPEALFDDGR